MDTFVPPFSTSDYNQLFAYLNETELSSHASQDPVLDTSFEPFRPAPNTQYPFQVAENMQIFNPDPPTNTKTKEANRYTGWRCPECDKVSRNLASLTNHFEQKHKKYSMDGSKVKRVLRTLNESDFGPTDCLRCEKKCSSMKYLRQHFTSRPHIETLIADGECPKDAILLCQLKNKSWKQLVDKTDFETVKQSIIALVERARRTPDQQSSSPCAIPLQAGPPTPVSMQSIPPVDIAPSNHPTGSFPSLSSWSFRTVSSPP